MIRELQERDIPQLFEIWKKHYADQFSFPDFRLNYIALFVVEDDETKRIITAGGIRTIVESILITDRELSPRKRAIALKQVLTPSCWLAERNGYSQIHAFIQEPDWERQLKSIGFRPCKGDALYYNL